MIALIVSRILAPTSKLATAKALDPPTAASSLGAMLGLGPVDEDELYAALDWLLARQPAIETALAGGTCGAAPWCSTTSPPAIAKAAAASWPASVISRDGKNGKLQIVFGLLCTAEGCPVAIEVFDGNIGDPKTLGRRSTSSSGVLTSPTWSWSATAA